jgi:hypothetical protein
MYILANTNVIGCGGRIPTGAVRLDSRCDGIWQYEVKAIKKHVKTRLRHYI